MRYELFLALRYLGGLRRSQPFVSVIAFISMCGVAVGVAALLVVLGVMSGFDADLQSKIVGFNPHLVVESESGLTQVDSMLESIKGTPHVQAAAPFVQTEVLLQFGNAATGAILRGVDPEMEPTVTKLTDSVIEGKWPPAPKVLFLGSELARRWRVSRGDIITVVTGGKSKPVEMVVGGVFSTGMYEYDSHLVLASLETVQELIGWQGREGGPKQAVVPAKVSGIGVRIDDPQQAISVKRLLQQRLSAPYWVMSWMDLNRNLFAALKLEKVTMFVILTLIVLVACFNIIATLLMVVVNKTKEIGILKAVGATSGSIRRIFTLAGLLIGLIGTAAGTGLGLALCAALAKYQFIQLPPEVYYIDRLPVLLQWRDGAAVVLSALAISWAACLYPAWVAARLQPAEAVRYE